MTANEIKRLEALRDKVKAHAGVSDRVTLTDANVKLMRKAIRDAMRSGSPDPEMVRLANKMGLA